MSGPLTDGDVVAVLAGVDADERARARADARGWAEAAARAGLTELAAVWAAVVELTVLVDAAVAQDRVAELAGVDAVAGALRRCGRVSRRTFLALVARWRDESAKAGFARTADWWAALAAHAADVYAGEATVLRALEDDALGVAAAAGDDRPGPGL